MNRTSDPATERAEILVELIGINSVNPMQAGPRSGPGGEQELAHWLAERLGALGAEVVLDEVEPGRPNVYARFGTGDRPAVAVDVHLDTVGVEHMTDDPFTGRIADGRVYGRGAVDTKGTLAVLLPLLAGLAGGGPGSATDLYVVGSVGEEAGGLPGANRFCQWAVEQELRFRQLIVAEPTLCAPVHGHKGGVGLEITVRGEAAHSSKPELGQNAMGAAPRNGDAFARHHNALTARPAITTVGPATLSVTEISGGLARNIIPDECRVYAGRRIAPGEDPEAVFVELSDLAREAASPLEITVAMSNGRCSAAFYQDPGSPLITELSDLAGESPTTATYGSNALAYREMADEIVVFGPGSIDQAHKAVEWVALSELDRAAQIYQRWLQLDAATS
jgi:acetylornithine deacetylase/succinyl-diaminopimelate desuccinylase-like protein